MDIDEEVSRLRAAYEAGEVDGDEADRLIRALAARRAAAAPRAPSPGEMAVKAVRSLLDDARTLAGVRAFCDAYLACEG